MRERLNFWPYCLGGIEIAATSATVECLDMQEKSSKYISAFTWSAILQYEPELFVVKSEYPPYHVNWNMNEIFYKQLV